MKCVATLDALLSLAKASREPGYCRAELLEGDGSTLKIEDGSHPCLSGDVVPNDLTVGGDAPHLLLLSGPNMSAETLLAIFLLLWCFCSVWAKLPVASLNSLLNSPLSIAIFCEARFDFFFFEPT